jgi:hypothetical protein
MVKGHEIMHAVDELVGRVPTEGLEDELKHIYNEVRNPYRVGDFADPAVTPVTPKDFGYKDHQFDREYMIEAMHAYARNPAYFKEMYPKTATAIRDAVNPNEAVRHIIQFNSFAPPAAVLGGGGLLGGFIPSEGKQGDQGNGM